jgi:type II secretory pathway component GspD/PulD (secretin)
MIGSHDRLTRAGKTATAALVSLGLAASAPVQALAQGRRRADPEVNPQFQQQLGGPVGGGPISEPAASAEPDAAPLGSRQVQGVQIGAAAPARAAAATSTAPLDTRVTVRVKGAPLATFLDTISAQAKVNFIITEGLETKRVTAFLQNVTVREALQVLLEIKGLTYQQIGKSNTYVVTPRSKQVENLITRIYTLNYVPLIALDGDAGAGPQQAQAGLPAPSGGAGGAGGGGGQGGGGGGNQGGGAQAGGLGQAGQSAGSVAIINVINSVLSRSGHVVIEPRTNALVVTDIPEVFPQVEQIIAELDKKAPQVMIETQIVEINSNRSRELGFEWGGPNGELASFTGGARDTSFPLNLPNDLSRARFFDPLSRSGGIISTLGNAGTAVTSDTSTDDSGGGSPTLSDTGFLQTSVFDLTQLRIVLRALISRSEARFLGKPKILTLNNKSAFIQISSQEAVAFQVQQGSAGGASSLTVSAPERLPTGLRLRVTPQVNKEGYITMLIQPDYTDIQESSISRASNRVFNPIQRGASTLVRVKNGQTLVMGGLLRSTETKVVRKVPFLGYIPIIGWLFTSSSTRRVNSDLVIFITPTIVSD